jgi:copper chaperone CopZ
VPGEATRKTLRYTVAGNHYGDGDASITEELAEVVGVESVDVDLDKRTVAVHGHSLSDPAMREAIRATGYEPA